MAEHTTPYAPSPTTSWISYCSETLKEIFLEPPDDGAARDMMPSSSYFLNSGKRFEMPLSSFYSQVGWLKYSDKLSVAGIDAL